MRWDYTGILCAAGHWFLNIPVINSSRKHSSYVCGDTREDGEFPVLL